MDAVGAELLDHLDGRPGRAVLERDDGHVRPALPAEVFFAPPRRWPRYERAALRFVRGRVLDVGCGAGRHALYLQARGHEVVGIDVSPGAIEVSRRRGVRDARVLPLSRVSRRQLGLFDTVLMMCGNFGLLGDEQRARRILRRLHAMTRADGRIVADTVNPHRSEDHDNLAYHERNRRAGRLAGSVRIRLRYRRLRTPWFDHLNVSRDEMSSVVEDTGWVVAHAVEEDGSAWAAILEKRAP